MDLEADSLSDMFPPISSLKHLQPLIIDIKTCPYLQGEEKWSCKKSPALLKQLAKTLDVNGYSYTLSDESKSDADYQIHIHDLALFLTVLESESSSDKSEVLSAKQAMRGIKKRKPTTEPDFKAAQFAVDLSTVGSGGTDSVGSSGENPLNLALLIFQHDKDADTGKYILSRVAYSPVRRQDLLSQHANKRAKKEKTTTAAVPAAAAAAGEPGEDSDATTSVENASGSGGLASKVKKPRAHAAAPKKVSPATSAGQTFSESAAARATKRNF